MLQVINGKQSGFLGNDKIYIGRKCYGLSGSPLQNPYSIGRDGDRDTVIEKYRKYLWENIKQWKETGSLNPVVNELFKLSQCSQSEELFYLSCWCKPEACHGDIIVKAVMWLNSFSLTQKDD